MAKMRFAGQFEAQHLQNDRDGFDHENAAHDHEEQFLFTTNRDDADHAADRERAGVAHENFRRMTVEPEKAEAGADERRANDRQLAGEGIKRDLEIFARCENCRPRKRAARRRTRP